MAEKVLETGKEAVDASWRLENGTLAPVKSVTGQASQGALDACFAGAGTIRPVNRQLSRRRASGWAFLSGCPKSPIRVGAFRYA